MVVIPYLRYFPKNVIYIYILEILSPKCEMLSPTWKTICCFWSQIVCNQQYDALKECREFPRGLFRGHQDHTRSPVMMIRWGKRWWHIYDLFSSPNPLLIIPTAKPIVKRLLLRDVCVWRFFFFWLSHFPARFAISNYLSVWIWFLQQFIHTWNIKWVDYKMNWKHASISSIALRISWLCFVSANFLSVVSSTTGLGPTPGSLGW